jgi:hypothetical protein
LGDKALKLAPYFANRPATPYFAGRFNLLKFLSRKDKLSSACSSAMDKLGLCNPDYERLIACAGNMPPSVFMAGRRQWLRRIRML